MRLALFATIWVALAAFVAGEAGKLHRPMPRWPWIVSLVGALLCAVHIVIALGYHHRWNHAAAVTETAQRTAAVYGIPWRGGVYVNYLFLAAWLAELWLWRARPQDYFDRSAVIVWALRAFFFIIIVNAAVVFATPQARPAGIAVTVALVLIWAQPSVARRPHGER